MTHSSHLQTGFIDLTHTVNEKIPLWPGSTRFSEEIRQECSPGKFRGYDYHLCAGTGTHIDAPFHCVEDGKSVTDFSLQELIGPGCVIDVTQSVQNNPDYTVSAHDIEQWENQFGPIPSGAIILARTGWSQYWSQPQRYCNADVDGVLHFPGFSEEAAQLLVTKNIIGVGIDTLSLDAGVSKTYPAHKIFLGHGLFQIENIAHLQQLPPVGATILVLPLKIENAPEAPARVIAIISA